MATHTRQIKPEISRVKWPYKVIRVKLAGKRTSSAPSELVFSVTMFFRTRPSEGATDTASDMNSNPTQNDDVAPPSYTEIANTMHALALGDPRERISVPMVHTSSQGGRTVQTVVVRKMTREYVPEPVS